MSECCFLQKFWRVHFDSGLNLMARNRFGFVLENEICRKWKHPYYKGTAVHGLRTAPSTLWLHKRFWCLPLGMVHHLFATLTIFATPKKLLAAVSSALSTWGFEKANVPSPRLQGHKLLVIPSLLSPIDFFYEPEPDGCRYDHDLISLLACFIDFFVNNLVALFLVCPSNFRKKIQLTFKLGRGGKDCARNIPIYMSPWSNLLLMLQITIVWLWKGIC